MNIIVEGGVIFFNNLYLEEIWSEFGNTYNVLTLISNIIKNCFGKYKLQGNLKSLPYNGYFLNMYKEELEKYHIHIALHKDLSVYHNQITKDMNKLHNIKKIVYYENKEELDKLVSEHDESFMNNLRQLRLYKSKFGIARNILSFIMMVFTTNVQYYRMSILNSFMWILWSMFHYYYSLLYMIPLFFSINSLFNSDVFITSWGVFTCIFSMVKLIRGLQEIDYERSITQKEAVEPLIASEYIFNGACIATTTWIIGGLLCLLIYLGFRYPIITIVNIFVGLIYYIFMLSPFIVKNFMIILAICISHIILQYKWVINLLWKF